jgi:hypothetical protein
MFIGCSALKHLILPSTLCEIAPDAFAECKAISEITVCARGKLEKYPFPMFKGIKKLTVDGSVTDIGAYAFDGCTSFTHVILKPGVKTVGDYAFSRCKSIISLELPEGLCEIHTGAFKDCAKLPSVTLPESLRLLGPDSLAGCSSLALVVLKTKSIGMFDRSRAGIKCKVEKIK